MCILWIVVTYEWKNIVKNGRFGTEKGQDTCSQVNKWQETD